MKKYTLGVVIYTHNRVDDARINIELIRSWKTKLFSNIKIFHVYNGEKSWYEKTNEDKLIIRKNPGHQKGAADLIDTGILTFFKEKELPDYILTIASDTWLTKPDYLEKVVTNMAKDKLVIATASWGSNKDTSLWEGGLATDFFVIDANFAKKYKLFPFEYGVFSKKYSEVLDYLLRNTILERLFSIRLIQALGRSMKIPGEHLRRMVALKMIYRMKEREPVHLETKTKYDRKMFYPKINLLTHHDPKEKRKILKASKDIFKGTNILKLLTSKNLDYYNGGHVKNQITLPNGRVVSMH